MSEGAPRVVVTVDDRGNIVELDPAAEDAFRITRDEAVGLPIAELIVSRGPLPDHWIHVRGSEPAESVPAADPALPALLETAEELAQVGTWDWYLDAGRLRWSANFYRIHGLEPGAGMPTPDEAFALVHPDDRGRVQRALEDASAAGSLPPVEYRIVRPDGRTRHVRASGVLIDHEEGRSGRLVGSIQDITERRLAERQIAAHVAISEALAEWRTLEQGATGVLRNLAGALECAAGALWLPEGDVLAAHTIWPPDTAQVPELAPVIRQVRLPRGFGLAGRVWEAGEAVAVPDLEDDPRFRIETVPGLHGAAALPARYAEEVLGVLELYFCDTVSGETAEQLLPSLAGIGHAFGLFLAQRRGELKPTPLTPRQREVLQLASYGRSGREIAERLVLSPATVRTHFEHIYAKYGVSDRAAAVAKALRDGLID